MERACSPGRQLLRLDGPRRTVHQHTEPGSEAQPATLLPQDPAARRGRLSQLADRSQTGRRSTRHATRTIGLGRVQPCSGMDKKHHSRQNS